MCLFTTKSPAAKLDTRFREPLPRAPNVFVPKRPVASSRRSQSRHATRFQTAIVTNRALSTLRKLGGWETRLPSDSTSRADRNETERMRSLVSEHVVRQKKLASDLAAEKCSSDFACFQRLCRDSSRLNYGGVARGEVVPSQLENISIPACDSALRWEESAPSVVGVYANGLLFPEGGLDGDRLECINNTPAYVDPKLRGGRELSNLVAKMFQVGMVRPIQRKLGPHGITMFTVAKTFPAQRLVFDLRRKNLEFATPPHCEMASLEAIASLDLSHNWGGISVAAGDVPDYFYRLRTPDELHERFWLAGVSVVGVKRELSNLGVPLGPEWETAVGLGFCCPPMGWSWAPWIAQENLEYVLDKVPGRVFESLSPSPAPCDDPSVGSDFRAPPGLPITSLKQQQQSGSPTTTGGVGEPGRGPEGPFGPGGRMVHGKPPPDINVGRPAHWELLDDYGVIVVSENSEQNSLEQVQAISRDAADALRRHGLDAHKEQVGMVVEALGGGDSCGHAEGAAQGSSFS